MASTRALSADEARALKKSFDAIKPGKKFQFAYIEAASDGRPLLLLDRKNVAPAARDARKTARKKKMCRGAVALMDDRTGYRFTTDAPHPRLALHLVRYFGKAVPRLRRSEIVVPGQPPVDLGTAAQGAREDAVAELDDLQTQVAALTARLQTQSARAVLLGDEARALRDSYLRTRSEADAKQEEADSARDDAAAIRKELDALADAIAAACEDAEALREGELLTGYEELDIRSAGDLDRASAQLDTLEAEAIVCEDHEAEARSRLDALEASARELEKRVLAKERTAQKAQLQVETTRGTLYRMRSTTRRHELLAKDAAHAAEDLREEHRRFKLQLAAARAAIQTAAAARLEARGRATAFADQYSEAEKAWWAQHQPQPPEALLASSGALATAIAASRDTQATARAAEAALHAAQSTLRACTQERDEGRAQQAELRARIRAIESGTVEVDRDTVAILASTHRQLQACMGDEAALLARLDSAATAVTAAETETDEARAAAVAAEQAACSARLARNGDVLFAAEREQVAALYAQQPLLRDEVALLRDEVALLRDEEAATQAAVTETITARRALQDAHTDLHLLVLEEDALRKTANRWSFGRRSRREESAQAKQALVDIRVRREAASAAFDDARQALDDALESASSSSLEAHVGARHARLAHDQALARKELALADIEAQLAAAEARASGRTLDLLTAEQQRWLDALAETDPKLRAATDARDKAGRTADKVTAALLAQEQRLGALQEQITTLSDALSATPTRAGELADLLAQLAGARADAQAAQQAADLAATQLEDAEADVEAEHQRLCAEEPALARLAEATAGARAEAQQAAERDARAVAHRERAVADAETARRSESATFAIAEMNVFITTHQDLLDDAHTLRKPERLASHVFSSDEVVDANARRSETLDLSRPDALDRLRSAIAARVEGTDNMDPRFGALLDFQQALEDRAIEMITGGATAADLHEAFARIPNGLRPPSCRAEVEAFHTLEAAFAEAEAEQQQRSRDARLLEAADALTPPSARLDRIKAAFVSMGGKLADLEAITAHIPNTQEMAGRQSTEGGGWDAARTSAFGGAAGESNPELVVHLDNVFSSLGALTGTVGAVSAFVDLSRDTREKDLLTGAPAPQDPIEQRMQQDKLLDAVSSAVSATLHNVKQFGAMDVAGNIPILGVLGTVDQAKQLAEHIVKASVRRGKARYDKLLADGARVAGSPLAGAFEESVAREQQLWARHGLDASANAATIASHILRGGPPTYAIGVALQIAATAISLGNAAAHTAIDRDRAARAKALLRAARRGDEQAKTELFQNHARYAKGLIAHMAATERDRFALLYVNKRGIDEQMVAQSSARILAHYLLVEAEQDPDPETWADWRAGWRRSLSAAAQSTRRAFSAASPVRLLRRALDGARSGDAVPLDPSALEPIQALESDAARLATDHRDARDLRDRIDARLAETTREADRAAISQKRVALSALIDRYDDLFREIQDGAVGGLRALGEDEATLSSLRALQRTAPGRLSSGARETITAAETWMPALQQSLVAITQHLVAGS